MDSFNRKKTAATQAVSGDGVKPLSFPMEKDAGRSPGQPEGAAMNIIEAMRAVLKDGWDMGEYVFPPGERRVTVIAAQVKMFALIEAYEALAPDWTQAPEWAQWYTIDADGEACFTDIESEIVATVWSTYSGNMLLIGSVNLPIGIDWRLCKWKRPEV